MLDAAIASWGGSRNDITLLRSYTQKQYEDSARARLIKKGMTRLELVIARGYPPRVTWLRRKRTFYEAWSYASGAKAFFADGNLFLWQSP